MGSVNLRRSSSLSGTSANEKMIIYKEQLNSLNEKIHDLGRSKALAHEKGNFSDVENYTQLITSLHNERHNLEEKLATLEEQMKAEKRNSLDQALNFSPDLQKSNSSENAVPNPSSRSNSVSSGAPQLPSVPKPILAPKKPSPYYAQKMKELHFTIKKHRDNVKFFRSNGEMDEADKVEAIANQLQVKLDRVSLKLRLARQHEFKPPTYTSKHHEAAKKIQLGYRIWEARRSFKLRCKYKRNHIYQIFV